MQQEQQKRSEQPQTQPQPGSLNSFNNREEQRSGETEKAKEQKDESEGYMDYNGNSEANAPARAAE